VPTIFINSLAGRLFHSFKTSRASVFEALSPIEWSSIRAAEPASQSYKMRYGNVQSGILRNRVTDYFLLVNDIGIQ